MNCWWERNVDDFIKLTIWKSLEPSLNLIYRYSYLSSKRKFISKRWRDVFSLFNLITSRHNQDVPKIITAYLNLSILNCCVLLCQWLLEATKAHYRFFFTRTTLNLNSARWWWCVSLLICFLSLLQSSQTQEISFCFSLLITSRKSRLIETFFFFFFCTNFVHLIRLYWLWGKTNFLKEYF